MASEEQGLVDALLDGMLEEAIDEVVECIEGLAPRDAIQDGEEVIVVVWADVNGYTRVTLMNELVRGQFPIALVVGVDE